MKCYIGKFKTKYNLDDICGELLSFLSNQDIFTIFEENIVLKLKCNILKKTDIINLSREKTERGILDLYKTNEEIKNSISKQWNKQINGACIVINKLDVDKIKKVLNKEGDAKSLFQYATLLWNKNEEEFNLLGDMAYEIYLLKKDNYKYEKGGCKMENNILDISLGEILKLSKGENTEKQEQLEVDIKTNSDEIKKISQQMKIVLEFNKEIKKLLNSMAEQIKTLTKEVTNGEINNKISLIGKELKEVSSEIKQIKQVNEKSEQAHKKELSVVNANIKGIADAVKTQDKVLEKLNEVSKELKYDINNISAQLSNLDIKISNDNKNTAKSIKEKVEVEEERDLVKEPEKPLERNTTETEPKTHQGREKGPDSEVEKDDNTLGELLDQLLRDK